MKHKINIKTKLPGPIVSKLIEKDNKYVSSSYTRSYPLVARKGEGMFITDPDGNVFMDFAAGIAVCSTGHCHPNVVKVIQKQASELIHMSGTDFYYESQIQLAEKLANISPLGDEDKQVFFGNSGAEAVEAALKLARWYTKRPINISFVGAFHGRTMGALSLTCSKPIQKNRFYPMLSHTFHLPYPYCYRCPFNMEYPKCDMECVKYIEYKLTHMIPHEQVAAIFIEPIQGEGGYIDPPPGFHEKLYEIVNSLDILYVIDEVQSGMGRTGKMFAIEHYGSVGDIITLAKGIASGMPLGVMIAPGNRSGRCIMSWPPGAHASTFGGNPISCVAAFETIKLLENGLIKNAGKRGNQLMSGLSVLQKTHDCIGDIRGKGLMVGMEMVKDQHSKIKAPYIRDKIVAKAFTKGLLLLGCGENTIRFSPPLIITKKQIDTCLNIIEDILNEIE